MMASICEGISMEQEDIIKMYRDKFGEDPQFSTASWMRDYPIERVWAAIKTGIPIREAQPPKGAKT